MKYSDSQIFAMWAKAKQERSRHEPRFDQAFRFTMPGRSRFLSPVNDTDIDDVFDETAIVAVQEFASRLQAGVTPDNSRWVSLRAGSEIPEEDEDSVNAMLDEVDEALFETLSASNFSTEIFESYLDLSVSLGAMEISAGDAISRVVFNAIPMHQLWVLNGPDDRIDRFFRVKKYTLEGLEKDYPGVKNLESAGDDFLKNGGELNFLQVTYRDWENPNDLHYRRCLYMLRETTGLSASGIEVFETSYKGIGSCPIIAFRWSKAAGEVWGRGPVINVLPAIKTCNMVVQLILENAQMSIAGLYNADDDGNINVNTIQLVPGTIIPRAPGTRGLEPVQPAGDFRVADLVLQDQRANIKRGLYNDMLGNPDRTPMSATEVAERMADLARQIGAAYGRLNVEMVQMTIQRVIYILKELGVITLPVVNGRTIKVVPTSPLAQAQAQQDITAIDRLTGFVISRFGQAQVNLYLKGDEISKYVAEKLQVPAALVRNKAEQQQLVAQMNQMAQNAGMIQGQDQEPQEPAA